MTTPILTRRIILKGLLASTACGLVSFGTTSAEAAGSNAVSAIKAAIAGNFADAGSLAQASNDPAAIKLVELMYIRDQGGKVGYGRIMAFLDACPKWPIAETISKLAEHALYVSRDKQQPLVHFANRKPLSAEGHVSLARAHYANGQIDNAKAALRSAWLDASIDAELESAIASEFSSKLGETDNRARLWRLIYAQESNAAVRFAKKLGGEYNRIASVAQALLRSDGGAEKKYDGLSSTHRNIPALRYALARHYRKQEKYSKARQILAIGPTSAADMGDPEAWWVERRIIARRSIGPNHKSTWSAGYKIASAHGLTSGSLATEAEFLSGWIALRYLNAPDTAMKHFAKLKAIAPSRTEKARAVYWIGRTHLAAGNKSEAKSAFREASEYSTIYYGQLAREYVGLGDTPEKIVGTDTNDKARRRVDNDEVVRAFRLMSQAGGKTQLNWFLWSIASRFDSIPEMNAAAAVLHGVGGTTMSLRFAKAAGQRNVDIDAWSYPIRGLPEWKTIGKPVEKALVFALSRQESEFDPNAGSKVGAQGLMQIMPGTAKLIAKQYGLSYAPGKLTGDPAYNVKLGAAHLADLTEDFGGSYILTLVAYNAGPRRAREWVEEFGDPRSGQVDPVDWVESIPFQETRQYVQKVLQNLHIYRSRLAPKTVRPMSADLRRGSPADIAVASVSAPPERDCSSGSIAGLIRGCD